MNCLCNLFDDCNVWIILIALVIIFQPELRRALEELGKKNVLFNVFKLGNTLENERFSDKSVEEITRATLEMAKAKTGALMVITQEHDLGQYIETGIRLDAKITSQLLINIFEKNTPLHDGAVIIEGDEIVAATCYIPLSDSTSLSKELGTRHRAGLGLSELTDSIIIIVSEETGSISIAKDGKLIRYADAAILKNELTKAQAKDEVKTKKKEKVKNNILAVEEKEAEEVQNEAIQEQVDNYEAETTFNAKPSFWQRFKNSKVVRAVTYVFKIRIRIELPSNALPEGRGDNN